MSAVKPIAIVHYSKALNRSELTTVLKGLDLAYFAIPAFVDQDITGGFYVEVLDAHLKQQPPLYVPPREFTDGEKAAAAALYEPPCGGEIPR